MFHGSIDDSFHFRDEEQRMDELIGPDKLSIRWILFLPASILPTYSCHIFSYLNPAQEVITMEEELLNVARYAVEQPGVTGYICVDKEGLCLATEGQANQSMSGIVHQLADLASKIEESNQTNGSKTIKESPVIRVDLERYKIIIQSQDSITNALLAPQK